MKIFNGKMGRGKKGRGGDTHERSTEEVGGPRRGGGVCGRASFGGTVLEHVVVVIEAKVYSAVTRGDTERNSRVRALFHLTHDSEHNARSK